MKPGITVVIPSIPSRANMLGRAVASAAHQVLPPERIIVSIDNEQSGAAATRTRGLMQVETEWTAFLDDDDYFLPEHLSKLHERAVADDADMAFSWFTVMGSGRDPFPMNEHKEWTREDPHETTITFLVRTEVAKELGGFILPGDVEDPEGRAIGGEDFNFVIRLADAGHKIVKVHERTWVWVHHRGNTSGLPSNRPS